MKKMPNEKLDEVSNDIFILICESFNISYDKVNLNLLTNVLVLTLAKLFTTAPQENHQELISRVKTQLEATLKDWGGGHESGV